MEDIILLEYLKKKGILNTQECVEILSMKEETNVPHNKSDKYSEFFDSFKEVTEDMNYSEKDKFIERLKDYNNKTIGHFNEPYAKFLVSKMWHKDDLGIKCVGERYNTLKAKEVHERYKSMIPSSVTDSDIYIAINSQYHNSQCLFKKWFGSDADSKIIEHAIIYWFKDDDWGISKLWDCFNK